MSGAKKYDEQRVKEREGEERVKSPKRREIWGQKNQQPHYHYQHHRQTISSRESGWGFVLFFMPIRKSRKTVCLEKNASLRCMKTKKDSQFIFTRLTKLIMLLPFHSIPFRFLFSQAILKLVHTPQTSTLYIHI